MAAWSSGPSRSSGAASGFGVELNPDLVKESQDNAGKAKVDNKVAFRQGDVLKIDDIGDTSVVLLYMGDDINLRLRPILQSKLLPGSRVVSHRFTMGDWEPTTTQKLKGEDGDDYEIHLWVISDKKGREKVVSGALIYRFAPPHGAFASRESINRTNPYSRNFRQIRYNPHFPAFEFPFFPSSPRPCRDDFGHEIPSVRGSRLRL